jgi:hypothetical protein
MFTLDHNDAMRLDYLAEQWRDGDCGFIGIGSGGRAHVLVTLLPIASAIIARRRGADVRVQIGPLLGVDLGSLPESFDDSRLYRWSSEAFLETDYNFRLLKSRRIDLGFVSAAQIDVSGRLNVNRVDGRRGTVRLGGALAVPELCHSVRKVMVIADLNERVFVPSVDYCTARLRPARDEERGRLARLVTDGGVFHLDDGAFVVHELFPGWSKEKLGERVGWPLRVLDSARSDRTGLSDRERVETEEWIASALALTEALDGRSA